MDTVRDGGGSFPQWTKRKSRGHGVLSAYRWCGGMQALARGWLLLFGIRLKGCGGVRLNRLICKRRCTGARHEIFIYANTRFSSFCPGLGLKKANLLTTPPLPLNRINSAALICTSSVAITPAGDSFPRWWIGDFRFPVGGAFHFLHLLGETLE